MNVGDPVGKAILDYAISQKPDDIIVSSEICEDDIIPIEVLFRNEDTMPEIEKIALNKAKGKILDVGAGAGSHSFYLKNLGFDVKAIDISAGAIKFLKDNGITSENINFFDLKNEKFDTILMLMNGIGIAGKLSNLEKTLVHAASLLNENGKLYCDSSDIKYLYEDEDGSMWVNLNTEYYGNFRFQMKYKKEIGNWFDWLYVDFDSLFQACKNVGLKCIKVADQEDHYLAEISK